MKVKWVCVQMMNDIGTNENCCSTIVFGNEATFYASGKVNDHNILIWG